MKIRFIIPLLLGACISPGAQQDIDQSKTPSAPFDLMQIADTENYIGSLSDDKTMFLPNLKPGLMIGTLKEEGTDQGYALCNVRNDTKRATHVCIIMQFLENPYFVIDCYTQKMLGLLEQEDGNMHIDDEQDYVWLASNFQCFNLEGDDTIIRYIDHRMQLDQDIYLYFAFMLNIDGLFMPWWKKLNPTYKKRKSKHQRDVEKRRRERYAAATTTTTTAAAAAQGAVIPDLNQYDTSWTPLRMQESSYLSEAEFLDLMDHCKQHKLSIQCSIQVHQDHTVRIIPTNYSATYALLSEIKKQEMLAC